MNTTVTRKHHKGVTSWILSQGGNVVELTLRPIGEGGTMIYAEADKSFGFPTLADAVFYYTETAAA